MAEFWRKNPKKKPRKSVEPKAAKRSRRSLAVDEESDTGSVAKKRGRKSTTKAESDEEEEEAVRNKKARKAEKTGGRIKKLSEEPSARVTDMGKYMDRETWEDLVDTVDTVERSDEGLVIYFTLYVLQKRSPILFVDTVGHKENRRTDSRGG